MPNKSKATRYDKYYAKQMKDPTMKKLVKKAQEKIRSTIQGNESAGQYVADLIGSAVTSRDFKLNRSNQTMCNRHAIHVFEQLKKHVTESALRSFRYKEFGYYRFRLTVEYQEADGGFIDVELNKGQIYIHFGFPQAEEDTLTKSYRLTERHIESVEYILPALVLGVKTLQDEKERLEADWVCQPLSTLRR